LVRSPLSARPLEDVAAAHLGVDEGRKVDLLPALEHLAADQFGVLA
jgi:hypothetical protein